MLCLEGVCTQPKYKHRMFGDKLLRYAMLYIFIYDKLLRYAM